jgi:hypothetical protein
VARARVLSGLPVSTAGAGTDTALADRPDELPPATHGGGDPGVAPPLGAQLADEVVPLGTMLAGESLGLTGQPVFFPGAHGSRVHVDLAQTVPRKKSASRFGTAESNPATSRDPGSFGSAMLTSFAVMATTARRTS